MTQTTTTAMTIYRTFNNPVFYDAAGIPEYEKEDIEIEVEVTGTIYSAEPDVGIMSPYFDDISATRLDNEESIELTEKEQDQANELLLEASADDYYDYLENMRD